MTSAGDDVCEEPLSLGNTMSIRGMLILLIIVFHCSFYYHFEFPDIGHIAVASFLFFSGYGLELSLDRKGGYLRGFMSKRVFGILIQYWTIAIVIEIVGMALYLDATDVFGRVSDALFGIPHWFVIEILVLYVLFYLMALLFRVRTWIRMTVITVSSFIVIFSLYTHFDLALFYLSGAGFPFGAIWYHLQKHRSEGTSADRMITVSATVVSIAILLLFQGRSGSYGISDMLSSSVTCISSIVLLTMLCEASVRKGFAIPLTTLLVGMIAFVFTDTDREGSAFIMFASVAAIVLRSDMFGKSTAFLGVMSFEMYLIHETLYLYVWREVTQWEPLAFVVSLSLSILVSYITYRVSGKLIELCDKGMNNVEKTSDRMSE